jgi:N-acetylmuramoyl-L-alanine amidase
MPVTAAWTAERSRTASQKRSPRSTSPSGWRRCLQGCGSARWIMTREDDTFVALEERANMANRAGADLFVSVHLNTSGGEDDALGIETYYAPQKALSARLALRELDQDERQDSGILDDTQRAAGGDRPALRLPQRPEPRIAASKSATTPSSIAPYAHPSWSSVASSPTVARPPDSRRLSASRQGRAGRRGRRRGLSPGAGGRSHRED